MKSLSKMYMLVNMLIWDLVMVLIIGKTPIPKALIMPVTIIGISIISITLIVVELKIEKR